MNSRQKLERTKEEGEDDWIAVRTPGWRKPGWVRDGARMNWIALIVLSITRMPILFVLTFIHSFIY